MLPKAASAASVEALHAGCGLPVLALIETARGVLQAEALAAPRGVLAAAEGAAGGAVQVDAAAWPTALRWSARAAGTGER